MCVKHRKYRQKLPSGGAGLELGGGKAKTAPPAGIKTFCVFLLSSSDKIFNEKNVHVHKTSQITSKNEAPDTSWGSKSACYNVLKFKIWKGGGSSFWEAFEAENCPKLTCFSKNIA